MAINYIPLDKEKHRDLKLASQYTFEFAKDTHLAAATIREFAQLAISIPIFFVEDPNSKNIHSVAMLGIEQNKNLYWHDGKWQSAQVPLNIQRYPFDIRQQGETVAVFIDENSSLFDKEGESLFTENGEASEVLKNRQKFLAEITNSEIMTQKFIAKLKELDLFDDVQIQVQYANGANRNIMGIKAISEKKLHELSDEVILDLHKQGFLGAIYATLLSLGQLNRLVELSQKTEMPVSALQMRPVEQKQEAEKA